MVKILFIREVKLKTRLLLLIFITSFVFLPGNETEKNYLISNFSLVPDHNFENSIPAIRYFLSDETKSSPGNISFGKKTKKKKLGRAILINGSLWLIDSVRYWATYASWIEDWQFQLNWEDQSHRFFTFHDNRFDSNPFMTNWTHGIGGAIYFNIARYHNLTLLESVLFETTSSFIWEYFTEWREVISINDNFFSGLGGLPLGEPFYQLSKYLLSKKGTINHIAGYILNPVFGLSDLFGGKKWRSNFTEDYFSSPDLTLTISNENINYSDTDNSDNLFHFRARSEFLKIPGIGKESEEKLNQRFNTTFYSAVEIGISTGKAGIEEYTLDTKIIYLGHFIQHLSKDKNGKLKGYSLFSGLSSAFSLLKKKAAEEYDKGEYHYDFTNGEQPDQPVNFTDKYAIIDIFGPAVHFTAYSSPFRLELNSEAYFDFGLINSIALNRYSEQNDIFSPRMKTTLIHYGYYYAFGYTLNFNSKLFINNFMIQGGIKYRRYGSIQGLDRFQDLVDDDSKVCDSRSELFGALGYRIPGGRFSVSLVLQRIGRKGTLKDVTENETETRLFSSLSISF